MKLNKRECRKFADPGLKMQLHNGLVHAGQLQYIVRTAIKIINRHKTLVLYIYDREKAARGDFRPLWTMFHARDDFVTLATKEDGSSAWRTSSFEDLGPEWDFTRQCAFYTSKDKARVSRYFKNTADSGFMPLIKAQYEIQECRRRERQIKKEKQIIERMSCVPALPRGLKRWIHKSIMPSYFFYDYKKGGNDVPGVCSSCGKGVQFSGVKQGVKKTCPHCRKELVCKPRSRRSANMYDRDTVQVIQNAGNGELVLRIIKIYYTYNSNDMPDIRIYENARQFIRQDADGAVYVDIYYYAYHGGILTNWKTGERPRGSMFYLNFESDTSGHLYTKSLPDALSETPWRYCPIADFYNHFRRPLLSYRFLFAYKHHPSLEHLVKTGFYGVVNDLAYGYTSSCLDETQHRTHRILKVAAEDVEFLRGIDPDMDTLRTYQGYAGLKGRQELLLWQRENKISRDIMPILQHMTPHKLMRYLDNQYAFLQLRRTPGGNIRYKDMQALVTEYRDYLEICLKLNYDLKNSFVLYPKDLQKSHDKAAKHQKQKVNAKLRRDFNAAYSRIKGRLDFEHDGLKIIYPNSPNAVISEGHELHHCVGSYVDRVARQDCVILFLRQCSKLSKPFFTIEIRDWKIVQVRGMKNCDATPEVKAFIAAWEKRVLGRIDTAA